MKSPPEWGALSFDIPGASSLNSTNHAACLFEICRGFPTMIVNIDRVVLMVKSILAVCTLLAFTSLSNSVHAVLVGNDVTTSRAIASDIATEVLYLYANTPIPSAGYIDAFAIFDQSGNGGFQANAYVLRPNGSNTYLVLSENLVVGTGSNTTKYFPVPSISVMPGDIIAHHGNGIPFGGSGAGGSNQPIYYPSLSAPGVGNTITVPSLNYPTFPAAGFRDYAMAANFVPVPEPCSVALLGIAMLSIASTRRFA